MECIDEDRAICCHANPWDAREWHRYCRTAAPASSASSASEDDAASYSWYDGGGMYTRAGVGSSVDSVSGPTDSGSEDPVQRTTPNVATAADNEHGCAGRLSLLAIIFPANIVRLINSYLTTRCVWCDEGTGSLATVDGQYDWICIRCFTFTHDETSGGGRSVIDKLMRMACYRPGWRGPGGGNGSTDIQYRTVKRPKLG